MKGKNNDQKEPIEEFFTKKWVKDEDVELEEAKIIASSPNDCAVYVKEV